MSNENELKTNLCCKICDKEYASQSSLCNHNKKFHKKLVNKVTMYVDTPHVHVNSAHINDDFTTKNYNCKICNKEYASKSSLCNHNKKFHKIIVEIQTNSNNNTFIKNNICKFCNRIFNNRQNRWKHESKTCKQKKIIEEEKNKQIKIKELDIIRAQENKKILKLKLELKKNKLIKIEQNLETVNKNLLQMNNNIPVNTQLINSIIEKDKKIEELNNQLDNENKNLPITIIKEKINNNSLIMNNIVILSRDEDNFINAHQLCQAGDKLFNNWYCLETTKQLINDLANDIQLDTSQLVKIENCNFDQELWIHPDLAIQVAQWISPKFSLQFNRWIKTLFINNSIEINKIIKEKDNHIKLLQDTYQKRQTRINYPEKNVIYILTTEDHKKKRLYIIGKANKLKNRLSSYNKTAEHEVVYYKSCKTEENSSLIELMVLNKLNIYKEKANRDRFILPLEKDITFFTNTIDECIKFII